MKWNKRECFSKVSPGFTLLEVMIALAILSIALLGVFRLQAQTVSMNNRAKFNVTAPFLVQLKMSEFEVESFAETVNEGDFGEVFPGYTWRVSVDRIDSEMLGLTAEHLKKIDFSIAFNEDEFIYRIRTYRYIQE